MHAAQNRFPTIIGKEWNVMNKRTISQKLAVMGAALLLATSAFAANKGQVTISSPVQVGGKQLSAGQYSVQWDGNGPAVEANIMKGKKVVATVPARLVQLQESPNQDSAVVRTMTTAAGTWHKLASPAKSLLWNSATRAHPRPPVAAANR